MINAIYDRGKSLLEQTWAVSPNVTTYLASASRPGLCPFRVVVFDLTVTVGIGIALQQPIKYPNTTFTNGEKLLGVAMGPAITVNASVAGGGGYGYVPDCGPYYPISISGGSNNLGHSVDVRVEGIAPVLTDTTTSGTNILCGDYAVASTTANQDGTCKKGSLTNNAPAALQHVIGISYSQVTINNGVALVNLRWQEV